ncbi:MAG: beta-galactosidase [Anaerolineae bacterium]
MKRDSLLFILSFLGLLGASVITLSLISARDYELRGYNDAARDPNLPFLVPRFGVNAELTQYSAQELDQQFKLMESVNVNWVRQLVRWDQIEPEQGQFQWEAWDNIFDVLEKHPRLHMVPVFVNAPQWARRNGTSDSAPPTDPTSIVPFLNLFASRYGNYIDYYQIWDEPNLQSGWGGAAPHPAEYVALLAEAYKVIHQIDLQSFVLAAALAPTVETGPQNLSDWLYLHNMYSLGAKDYMDGVAAKPYGYDFSPLDRDVAPEKLNFSRIILLREEMIRNGDEKKSIWISNWGWNSLPSSWSGEKSIWGSVSSEQQIQYVKEAIDRVEREWPWIGGMILQQWQPDLPLDNPQWGFTLLNPDNTATVLFQSLGNLQSNQFAQNGFYPAVNPFVDYSGVWSFSQLGADIGWVQDSQLDFKFIGANVSMLLRKNNYTAYLYPTIDGQPANAVPRDSSGNSYVVLTSPEPLTPEISLVPIGRNLSSQFHTLHVIADRGWDQWAIAGFGVSSGDFLCSI